MRPTFKLGPWTLPTYSTAYSLALLGVGMWIYFREVEGLTEEEYSTPRLVFVTIASVAGAYVVELLPALLRYASVGVFVVEKGANWAGLVAAMVLFTWATAPRDTHFLGRTLDLAVVPLPIGLIIGRFGCMAAGCCYGQLTDSWLAMRLPDVVGIWAPRYPTRIMSAASELLVWVLMLVWERVSHRRLGKGRIWPFDGALCAIYCLWFCVERFALEFLRGDYEPWVGPFSWVHLFTGAGFVLTLIVSWRRWRAEVRTHASASR